MDTTVPKMVDFLQVWALYCCTHMRKRDGVKLMMIGCEMLRRVGCNIFWWPDLGHDIGQHS